MKIEQQLQDNGIILPQAPQPVGAYKPCVQSGNLVFLSGQATAVQGKPSCTGKVGAEKTLEEGYAAAKTCAVNLLTQLKTYLGDLDRVKKIVNLRGYVASDADFYQQPKVINGASDLLIAVFGEEIGAHSRTAIGVNTLPNNNTVEVEMVVEIF